MSQPSRHWLLTDYEGLEEPYVIPQYGDYTVGQVERCPSTGKLHWQLYCYTRMLMRPSAFKKLYPKVHFERARNISAAEQYGQKDETRVAGPFKWGEAPAQGKRSDIDAACAAYKGYVEQYGRALGKRKYADEHRAVAVKYGRGMEAWIDSVIEPFIPDVPSLRSHQLDAVERILTDQSNRRIFSVHDSTGGSGKSTVGTFLQLQHGAIIIGDGNYREWAYLYNGEPVVVFDLAKADKCPPDLGRFLEHLCDGRITCTKYEAKVKYFKKPKIVVFSNSRLPALTWTHDRLIEIDWCHHGILQEGPDFQA